MSKRISWIDVAKGILIFLVVLGHSQITKTTALVIYSFHMAAFFFLSGLTFSANNDFWIFLKKKLSALLLPYLAFSFLFLAFQFLKATILHMGVFNLRSGIVSVFIPISGRESTSVYGLWFLPCLFLTQVLGYIFLKVFKKNKLFSILFIFVIILLSFSLSYFSKKVSIIDILPISLAFLLLGYLFKGKEIVRNIKRLIALIICLILFIATVLLNANISKSTFDLSSMRLGFWPLYILSGIFGSFFICIIAMFAQNFNFLQMLGKNSLYYYGLHYLFIGIIEKIVNVKWGGIIQTLLTFGILIPLVYLYNKLKSKFISRRKV